jgi:hypothetical protein
MPLKLTQYLAAAIPRLTYVTNISHFWVILTLWERSLLQILVIFSSSRTTLNTVLLEKAIVPSLIKKLLGFYKTLRLSTLFILSHPRLGLPSDFHPPGFPTKLVYAPFPSPSVLHTPPISLVYLITRIIIW